MCGSLAARSTLRLVVQELNLDIENVTVRQRATPDLSKSLLFF
jgi:hypothetical protein